MEDLYTKRDLMRLLDTWYTELNNVEEKLENLQKTKKIISEDIDMYEKALLHAIETDDIVDPLKFKNHES